MYLLTLLVDTFKKMHKYNKLESTDNINHAINFIRHTKHGYSISDLVNKFGCDAVEHLLKSGYLKNTNIKNFERLCAQK